jgi:hypothetical protein
MTFSQRLLKYLMGVGIGLVFVAMAFGPRAFSCNYFPNARVLDEAYSKRLSFSPEAQAFLKAENLDTVFLKKELFAKSKIDFDRSKKDQTPCREYLATYESKDKTKNYEFVFDVCKEDSKLKTIQKK